MWWTLNPRPSLRKRSGLTVPGWGGHLAGQHIDLKLTAEDGYSAQRSYSLSRPADGERIELTVQQIADGEVSPYLTASAPPATRSNFADPSAAGSSGGRPSRLGFCWSAADRESCR